MLPQFIRSILIALLLLFPFFLLPAASPKVLVGLDLLFAPENVQFLRGKKIGLITNHTAINRQLQPAHIVLKTNAQLYGYTIAALFAPEHGIRGEIHAEKLVNHEIDPDGIPIYSLHGTSRRPSADMLKGINLLIFDIQDIGSRSYTYISTLFYVMEEAAKHQIPILVLDRPNPINGLVVDGPMLEEKWRSIVGYINVPYCHGMTIAELAQFFNEEYKIGSDLKVVPMQGWKRHMSFQDTGLTWVPTSPNIPEASTPFYYPMTGLLGELQIVNIGVGYTLPFKIVGAPWINAEALAKQLNSQNFPGVAFLPFYFCPFFGRFAKENCQGIQVIVTDPILFKPVSTQYLIIGMLKHLYPEKMKEALAASQSRRNMFAKVNGTDEVYHILTGPEPIIWKLRSLHKSERDKFLAIRPKYLINSYSN